MILDSTSKSVTIILAEAKVTSDCDLTAEYADITTSGFTPGSADGTTNGTTAVTLVAAPASSGIARHVKEVTIYNNDTVNHTVYIRVTDGASSRIVKARTLIPGDNLQYTDSAAEGPQGLSAGGSGTPADFGVFFSGTPDANQVMFEFQPTRNITLPKSLSGSFFGVSVNPSNTNTITLKQNGASIGTIVISNIGGVTVTFSAAVNLSAGDTFQVVANGTFDPTLSGVWLSFKASYT